MINQQSLNQVLIHKFIEVVDALNDEGIEITEKLHPVITDLSPTKSYLIEKEVPTNTVGRVDGSVDTQRGFYQIIVATPFSISAYEHRAIVDKVRVFYPVGTLSTTKPNNQPVSISTVAASGIYATDEHLKTALTINYTVIA